MLVYTMLISALSQGLLYAPMALGVFITFRILKTPRNSSLVRLPTGFMDKNSLQVHIIGHELVVFRRNFLHGICIKTAIYDWEQLP